MCPQITEDNADVYYVYNGLQQWTINTRINLIKVEICWVVVQVTLIDS